MANTNQSKKRVRQNERVRLHNRKRVSNLRTQIKRFLAAIEARNIDVAEREFQQVSKALDKTAKDNLIHSNAANRRKSRLARLLNEARVEHG